MDADEFIIHSTIRVEAELINGDISTGTGFFFTFFLGSDKPVPTIITNKHVVKNARSLTLHFSIAENGVFKEKEIQTFNLTGLENFILFHPDDNIDLCAIKIASLHAIFDKQNKSLYYATYSKRDIPTKEYILKSISNIEGVTIIGYPDGIWDSVNNLPVVRRGITATSLKYDFENESKFLIDSAIFGGSSGSPVVIFNQGAYSTKDTLYMGGRILLVGIVFAVAQHKVNGDIKIVDIPTNNAKAIAETNIPNNLGVVIKAHRILDFEPIIEKILLEEK